MIFQIQSYQAGGWGLQPGLQSWTHWSRDSLFHLQLSVKNAGTRSRYTSCMANFFWRVSCKQLVIHVPWLFQLELGHFSNKSKIYLVQSTGARASVPVPIPAQNSAKYMPLPITAFILFKTWTSDALTTLEHIKSKKSASDEVFSPGHKPWATSSVTNRFSTLATFLPWKSDSAFLILFTSGDVSLADDVSRVPSESSTGLFLTGLTICPRPLRPGFASLGARPLPRPRPRPRPRFLSKELKTWKPFKKFEKQGTVSPPVLLLLQNCSHPMFRQKTLRTWL